MRTTVSQGRVALAALVATMVMISVAMTPARVAAAEPQPDPAGSATGDRTGGVDAGGNPFVVPEPTDRNDPQFAEKKKAYDEFQAQAAREPLAMKLADTVGHVRVGTNFGWTLNTGYLVLFMQAGFA